MKKFIKKILLIILGVVVCLAIVMSITNPTSNEHLNVVADYLNKYDMSQIDLNEEEHYKRCKKNSCHHQKSCWSAEIAVAIKQQVRCQCKKHCCRIECKGIYSRTFHTYHYALCPSQQYRQ